MASLRDVISGKAKKGSYVDDVANSATGLANADTLVFADVSRTDKREH